MITLLKEGQYLCPRCNGKGYHEEYDTDDNNEPIPDVYCFVCEGDGFVDWTQYPRCQDWEQKDKKYLEEVEDEKWLDEHWDELADQENSSFIIEGDDDLEEED